MQILSTKHKLILINLFLTGGICGFSQDFEIAPVLVAFDANPGETQTQTLALRNHGNEKQKFVLNLADYTVNEEGAKISSAAGSSNRSLTDWIAIIPSFVELNPNEAASINLNITVPRTGFNTRWGMIQVEVAKEQIASDADKQLAAGVLVVPRIIVLVKQSPRSNQNFEGKVSGLREVENPKSEFRSFEATITNTGDKILDARAFLAIANLETAEEKQFNPMPVTIYPEQKRKLMLTLPETLGPGQYALAFLLDYGHRSAIEGTQILLSVEQ
jgi:hypothetical protein